MEVRCDGRTRGRGEGGLEELIIIIIFVFGNQGLF